MRTNRERNYLDADVWLFRRLDDVTQLPIHDSGSAKRPVQDRLVQEDIDLWRVLLGENLLTCPTFLDARLDRRIVQPGYSDSMDRSRIIGDLQESRNDRRLKDA